MTDGEPRILVIDDRTVQLSQLAAAQYESLALPERALVQQGLRQLLTDAERTQRYILWNPAASSRPEEGLLWLGHLLIALARREQDIEIASIYRVSDPRELP